MPEVNLKGVTPQLVLSAGVSGIGSLLSSAIATHAAAGTITQQALIAKQATTIAPTTAAAGITAKQLAGTLVGSQALGLIGGEVREELGGAFNLGEGGVRQLRSIIEDPNATPAQRDLAKKELSAALRAAGTPRLTPLFTETSEAEFVRKQAEAEQKKLEPVRQAQEELRTGKSLEAQSRLIHEANVTPIEKISPGTKENIAIALAKTPEEQELLLKKKKGLKK